MVKITISQTIIEKPEWKKPELTSLGQVSSIVLTGGWWWSCIHGDNDTNTIKPGCYDF